METFITHWDTANGVFNKKPERSLEADVKDDEKKNRKNKDGHYSQQHGKCFGEMFSSHFQIFYQTTDIDRGNAIATPFIERKMLSQC